MPSNNSKYTEEMRKQTAKFILETGKSATSVAEEMGIDANTVCWNAVEICHPPSCDVIRIKSK